MDHLEILDKDRLRRVLETFGWLDHARWEDAGNDDMINYCTDDLTADEKLLTHYLCYTMDRQTPFRRVWDIGGYVVSHLVKAYSRPSADVEAVWREHVALGTSLALRCDAAEPNAILKAYGLTGPSVEFRSRFMPSDLVCIWRTLVMLDTAADRSLGRYIATAVGREEDLRNGIRRVAAALDEMTYRGTRTTSAAQFEDAIRALTPDIVAKGEALRTDAESCLQQWVKRFEPFGKKRLWCSVRDYLKCPELNTYLVEALEGAGMDGFGKWQRENPALIEALDVLELPGDVWNNSPVLRDGLFAPYIRWSGRRWDTPRVVRETHTALSQEGLLGFYPEQLDVTFDFVPRMCEQRMYGMCGVCPFGSGIGRVCHQQPGLWCPVALITCGYRTECVPRSCRLLSKPVDGICRVATAGAEGDDTASGTAQ